MIDSIKKYFIWEDHDEMSGVLLDTSTRIETGYVECLDDRLYAYVITNDGAEKFLGSFSNYKNAKAEVEHAV